MIKIDGDDNDQTTFQPRTRELVLNGSGENGEKKSKTILTKFKSNIAVNTQKQYQTYKLFADLRRKTLETIKEQRDMLQKINAARSRTHRIAEKTLETIVVRTKIVNTLKFLNKTFLNFKMCTRL